MSTRLCKTLSLIALIALVAFGQMAFAADSGHKYQLRAVVARQPGGEESLAVPNTLKAGLYGLTQAFTTTDYPTVNSDGTDIWPCPGGAPGANGGPSDCATIGLPPISFAGGWALGTPQYSWSLSACDQTTSTSPVCGQTETFYEDDSADSTDDLTYSITATQVQSGTTVYLADSGTVDFGPNALGNNGSAPIQAIIYGDTGFGGMGETGPNNGECAANYNYPSITDPSENFPMVIQASKTCGYPLASSSDGPVTITATTELATPKYTKETGTKCTDYGVASPCYDVKYTKVYSVSQKWTIWLY